MPAFKPRGGELTKTQKAETRRSTGCGARSSTARAGSRPTPPCGAGTTEKAGGWLGPSARSRASRACTHLPAPPIRPIRTARPKSPARRCPATSASGAQAVANRVAEPLFQFQRAVPPHRPTGETARRRLANLALFRLGVCRFAAGSSDRLSASSGPFTQVFFWAMRPSSSMVVSGKKASPSEPCFFVPCPYTPSGDNRARQL